MKRAKLKESPTPDTGGVYTGSIALALCGRDAGRLFVISGHGDMPGYVYITDGRTRRYLYPKKKKLRHLSVLGVSREARELIFANAVSDIAVRRILNRCGDEFVPVDITGCPELK